MINMHLFIFESLGTQELILIALVALIFLGPRRLPEMARKAGKIMSDLRNTTSEFRQTWEREVDFEEESRALKVNEIDKELEQPVPREKPALQADVSAPEIRSIDPARFEAARMGADKSDNAPLENAVEPEDQEPAVDPLSDKRTWL